MKNAITANYKKANENIVTKSNKEGNKLAKQTDMSDKIKMNGTGGNSIVSLKGNKENFINHRTIRLINPSKNEIGRKSKHILDQINTE